MAALQKFKLLATQCGVIQSPTRSPRTSPLVDFRRPKTTLRMLLTRSSSRKSSTYREMSYPQSSIANANLSEKKKGDKDLTSRTLKDLFVSSSSLEDEEETQTKVVDAKFGGKTEEVGLASKLGGLNGLGGEPGRAGWIGFRHRMVLRRAWRPMLMTIPE